MEWKNWSGSLSFEPGTVEKPESEREVAELVQKARREGRKIRTVGAGHSSSPLVKTPDILLSLSHFYGVEGAEPDEQTAIVPAGMTVGEAGADLYRYGLALHNTGDVDVQTLAGAISTGTHGTGVGLQNLSSMLIGVRMVTGTGEIREISFKNDDQLRKTLQVCLGTCGIFLKMKLKLQKAYHLHRKEWCVPLRECLTNLEEFQQTNRNFDFYWYPRTDLCKVRIMNEVSSPMPEISFGRLELERQGPGHQILPRSRSLKFDEMEYALPAEHGPKCFQEVREQILKNFRKEVAWRVLYRTIAADDAFLSPMSGRPSVSISLHHNAGLPFWNFFKAIEPIFRKYEGRPHWGKKHSLTAKELRPLYPHWESFLSVREKFDPDEVFLTSYLKKLLKQEL